MNLDDIARELGLSKSTVSRVISGKGNLSKSTRQRVNEFIERHNYQPNASAQRLATSKTNNIGIVLPTDAFISINTFFQFSLLGVCRQAAQINYDIVVTSVSGNDITYLKRLISRHSVDGVVLMRSLTSDPSVAFLKEMSVPFVTIGSCEDKTIQQVDISHRKACKELTSSFIKNGKKVALIIGDENYTVNVNRKRGYLQAFEEKGINPDENLMFGNIYKEKDIFSAVDKVIESGAEVLICGDDNICLTVLGYLDLLGNGYTHKLQIASYYDNPVLASRMVTAISVDDMSLGACAVLKLAGILERNVTFCDAPVPGYTINYRTQSN